MNNLFIIKHHITTTDRCRIIYYLFISIILSIYHILYHIVEN
jgi:hypothetical protein